MGHAQVVTNVNGVAVDTDKISWTWNAVAGAQSYKVLSSSANTVLGCVGPIGANPPDNSFLLTNLRTNSTFSVSVGADTGGTTCNSGALQAPLKEGPTFYTLAEQPAAANGPCGVSLCNVFKNGFTGNFNTGNNTTESKFKSVATKVSDGSFLTPGDINGQAPGTNAQINFNNAVPNTEYKLEVQAVNGGGLNQGQGQQLGTGFTVLGTTVTDAAAPTTLTVAAVGPASISITWSPNQNPADTEYQVQYSSQAFASGVFTALAFSVPSLAGYPNTLGLTITGLATNKNYEVRVTARNKNYHLTTPASVTATTTGGGGAGNILQTIPSGQGAQIRGTVGASDRPISLDIIPGTFDQTVTVQVSTRVPIGGKCGAIDAAYHITVTPALQPRFPVRIGLGVTLTPAPQAGITDNSRITISRYDPVSGACVPMATTVSAGANQVFAETNHFSSFAIQQVNPGDALSSVRIFPNPFYVKRQGMLTI
ncbi:MAG: fibronectin type III domain-containing protein, partial [Elusimicrobia bacterium]|nr:fibronectin type III domain-containing protein [Elusimicrobiota bacterium]